MISRRGTVSLKLTRCVLFGPPVGLGEVGTIALRAHQVGLRLAQALPPALHCRSDRFAPPSLSFFVRFVFGTSFLFKKYTYFLCTHCTEM